MEAPLAEKRLVACVVLAVEQPVEAFDVGVVLFEKHKVDSWRLKVNAADPPSDNRSIFPPKNIYGEPVLPLSP